MSPEIGVSILVASWNTRELLGRCLESIAVALGPLDGELIVVDNGSSDGSAEMVRERFGADRRVVLIANPVNEGFSRANNSALERARGETIVLANADLEVTAETLLALRDHLDQRPEAGLVTCRLVDPEGLPQSLHRRLPSLPMVLFGRTRWGRWIDRRLLGGFFRRRYRPRLESGTGWTRIEQAAGALMAIRRSTIEEVCGPEIPGLFDERFPNLGSDVDLCRRLRDAGYEVHALLDRVVVHHGSASLGQIARDTREQWWWEFIHLYYEQHEPRWKGRLLRLVATVR